MPEQPNHLDPTEADLDTVLEEVLHKPVDKGGVAENIKALEKRISQLETVKLKLLTRIEHVATQPLSTHLTDINKDIAAANERITHYRVQLRNGN